MKRMLLVLVVTALAFLVQPVVAAEAASCSPGTVDIQAGPIWDQQDAEKKCPKVCDENNGSWNGQWRTTIPGEMSVCGCTTCCKDVNAGPIWNQQDAEKKCPSVCSKANGIWNGQWRTTVPGEMSVCGCCGKVCNRKTVDEEAGPIWDQQDAERKCPGVCSSHDGLWNGQWRTTEPGRMSVCGCVECG
jgi:hypothetical protein